MKNGEYEESQMKQMKLTGRNFPKKKKKQYFQRVCNSYPQGDIKIKIIY